MDLSVGGELSLIPSSHSILLDLKPHSSILLSLLAAHTSLRTKAINKWKLSARFWKCKYLKQKSDVAIKTEETKNELKKKQTLKSQLLWKHTGLKLRGHRGQRFNIQKQDAKA